MVETGPKRDQLGLQPAFLARVRMRHEPGEQHAGALAVSGRHLCPDQLQEVPGMVRKHREALALAQEGVQALQRRERPVRVHRKDVIQRVGP